MSFYRPDTGNDGPPLRHITLSILLHFILIVVFLAFQNPFKVTGDRERERIMSIKLVQEKKVPEQGADSGQQSDKQAKPDPMKKQQEPQPTKKQPEPEKMKKNQKKQEKKIKKPEVAEPIKEQSRDFDQVGRFNLPSAQQETQVEETPFAPKTPSEEFAEANVSKRQSDQKKTQSLPDTVGEVRRVSYNVDSPNFNYQGSAPDQISMDRTENNNSSFGQSVGQAVEAESSQRLKIEPGQSDQSVRKLVNRPSFPYAKYNEILPRNALLIRYQLIVPPDGSVRSVEVKDDGNHPDVAREIIPWIQKWVYKESSTTDQVAAVVRILEKRS